MSSAHVYKLLIERLEELTTVVENMGVRQNNFMREARVTEVDPKQGTVVVDAQGVTSPHIPWLERAGAISEWNPPSVGERVIIMSPNGDLSRSFVLPGGFTDNAPPSHDKGAEKRTKIDGCVLTQSGEGLHLSVGGTTFSFTADGFKQNGGEQTHNNKNVGSDHVHGGVIKGGADTEGPH